MHDAGDGDGGLPSSDEHYTDVGAGHLPQVPSPRHKYLDRNPGLTEIYNVFETGYA